MYDRFCAPVTEAAALCTQLLQAVRQDGGALAERSALVLRRRRTLVADWRCAADRGVHAHRLKPLPAACSLRSTHDEQSNKAAAATCHAPAGHACMHACSMQTRPSRACSTEIDQLRTLTEVRFGASERTGSA